MLLFTSIRPTVALYTLTPRSRILPQDLTGPELVNKFPDFRLPPGYWWDLRSSGLSQKSADLKQFPAVYGTRRFITAFTSAPSQRMDKTCLNRWTRTVIQLVTLTFPTEKLKVLFAVLKTLAIRIRTEPETLPKYVQNALTHTVNAGNSTK
jgi:hypothetical protein